MIARSPLATLAGPDAHEIAESSPRSHLFGDWHGKRPSLASRGIMFDLQYVADFLWNVDSDLPSRGAAWDRIRGTIDIAFDSLNGTPGLYFHATGLWQERSNLGAYLGLLTGPSGMASQNTFRLDSWWVEKRWLDQRLIARVGQFAGQGLLRHAALRVLLHLRADGLRPRQLVQHGQGVRPTVDVRGRSARGAGSNTCISNRWCSPAIPSRSRTTRPASSRSSAETP